MIEEELLELQKDPEYKKILSQRVAKDKEAIEIVIKKLEVALKS